MKDKLTVYIDGTIKIYIVRVDAIDFNFRIHLLWPLHDFENSLTKFQ
jgi:hypothetical protein